MKTLTNHIHQDNPCCYLISAWDTWCVSVTHREPSQFYCPPRKAGWMRKIIRIWTLLCTVNSSSFWDGLSSPKFSCFSTCLPLPSPGDWGSDSNQSVQFVIMCKGKEGNKLSLKKWNPGRGCGFWLSSLPQPCNFVDTLAKSFSHKSKPSLITD